MATQARLRSMATSTLTLFAAAAFCCAAHAAPIAYVFTGTGTGSVGATAFTGAAFEIRLYGDTNAIVHTTVPDKFSNVVTGTFTVAGIGTATILGPDVLSAFSAVGLAGGGFGIQREQSSVLYTFLTSGDPGYGYDLAGPFGPLTVLALGAGGLFFVDLPSTLGNISMVPSPFTFTFQAISSPAPVPADASWSHALLAAVLLVLANLALRSRRGAARSPTRRHP